MVDEEYRSQTYSSIPMLLGSGFCIEWSLGPLVWVGRVCGGRSRYKKIGCHIIGSGVASCGEDASQGSSSTEDTI